MILEDATYLSFLGNGVIFKGATTDIDKMWIGFPPAEAFIKTEVVPKKEKQESFRSRIEKLNEWMQTLRKIYNKGQNIKDEFQSKYEKTAKGICDAIMEALKTGDINEKAFLQEIWNHLMYIKKNNPSEFSHLSKYDKKSLDSIEDKVLYSKNISYKKDLGIIDILMDSGYIKHKQIDLGKKLLSIIENNIDLWEQLCSSISVGDLRDICIKDIYYEEILLNIERNNELEQESTNEEEKSKKAEEIMKKTDEELIASAKENNIEDSSLDLKKFMQYKDYINLPKFCLLVLINYFLKIESLDDLPIGEQINRYMKLSDLIISLKGQNLIHNNTKSRKMQYNEQELIQFLEKYKASLYTEKNKEGILKAAKLQGIAWLSDDLIKKIGLTAQDVQKIPIKDFETFKRLVELSLITSEIAVVIINKLPKNEKSKISIEDVYNLYMQGLISTTDIENVITEENKKEEFKTKISEECSTKKLIDIYEKILRQELELRELGKKDENSLSEKELKQLEKAQQRLNQLSKQKRKMVELYKNYLLDTNKLIESLSDYYLDILEGTEEKDASKQMQKLLNSLYEDRIIDLNSSKKIAESLLDMKNYSPEDSFSSDYDKSVQKAFKILDDKAIIRKIGNSYLTIKCSKIPYVIIMPCDTSSNKESDTTNDKQSKAKPKFVTYIIPQEKYEDNIGSIISYKELAGTDELNIHALKSLKCESKPLRFFEQDEENKSSKTKDKDKKDKKRKKAPNTQPSDENTEGGKTRKISKEWIKNMLEKFGYNSSKEFAKYKLEVEKALNGISIKVAR